MKLHLLVYFTVISTFQLLYGQNLPPKEAYPLEVRQIHSGHSLTDPLFHPWPGQYRFLIYDILGGNYDNVGTATIPGSPMFWRWDNEHTLNPSARYDIADWELLVITEGVPLPVDSSNPPQITPAKEYLSTYVNNAWENGNAGNGTPTLLWTTWTNIDDRDGPFRTMLDEYELLWEEMMDHANNNRPVGATPVYIIPGHRMMARLYDDVQAGVVPGITTFDEFFEDTIHVNDLGAYAVAMIHYACIYNESPVGLPNDLFLENETNRDVPSEALARYLQTMIWEVVTNYSKTGITDDTLSVEEFEQTTTSNCFYPNPVNDLITLCEYENEDLDHLKIDIYTPLGHKVYSGNEVTIDVSNLSAGYYFIKKGNSVSKFIKL
ncbi:T9SS type A sorting domain-containing protein [Aquimarina brevivitae]|uniref:Putative secreted protein (Por secretion system target) n=1 Tax=Aquimarina brevivitae TaxID=323412 RepID=A0A4Q7NU09_9FLAO|nr:T9SS type A sorting domain-containing protein [Aquimarina brevivitae]RZS90663.1 putative secreted protein (Por secretion system target) [Aquimarina brevivitae]